MKYADVGIAMAGAGTSWRIFSTSYPTDQMRRSAPQATVRRRKSGPSSCPRTKNGFSFERSTCPAPSLFEPKLSSLQSTVPLLAREPSAS